MKYRIIVDSCCELPKIYEQDERIDVVPVGDDNADYVSGYIKAYETDADRIIVFTVSSKISESYKAAMEARHIYLSERKKQEETLKKIFVCDTKTASAGQTQLVLKCIEYIKEGYSFNDMCVRLMCYRNQLKTYFIVDNTDKLVTKLGMENAKASDSGKSKMKAIISSLDGELVKVAQGFGVKRAIDKMIDCIKENVGCDEERTIIISQHKASKQAHELKEILEKQYTKCKIIILDAVGTGVSYAFDGGVMVTI